MPARLALFLSLAVVPAFVVAALAQVNPGEAWRTSAHADRTAEAFRHWDADGQVPPTCAKCHTTSGMLDFAGANGSPAGAVDASHPPGDGIACDACHSPESAARTSVRFPSGFEAVGLGRSTVCAECHQGLESGSGVRAALGDRPEDVVSAELGLRSPHYLAAGPTLFGAEGNGAFQYDGRAYAGRTVHPAPVQQCAQCHDPHTLQVDATRCGACHEGSDSLAALRGLRFGLAADFDGDGNAAEGIAAEIETLGEALEAGIRRYAAEVAGKAVAFDPATYPYFFVDSDGDGAASAAEAVFPNRYDAWTPRMVAAAYNLMYAAKEPGAYAHNPRYMIQVLHDSLADLGEAVEIETRGLVRP